MRDWNALASEHRLSSGCEKKSDCEGSGRGGRSPAKIIQLLNARRFIVSLGFLFICLGILVCAPVAFATPLDDKIDAFKKSQKRTEAAVLGILKYGIVEDRSSEALGVVEPWLNQNQVESAVTEAYAGLTMQYAGDGPGAMLFYRKFLSRKNPDKRLIGFLVASIYRFILNDERVANEAYVFMRENGNRFREYGSAKRFDHLFLRTALQRRDYLAAAERMTVIYNDPDSKPGDYTDIVENIFRRVESFNALDNKSLRAIKEMAKAAEPSRPDLIVRLNWAEEVIDSESKVRAEVKKKNFNKNLRETITKPAVALAKVLPYKGGNLVVDGWIKMMDRSHDNFEAVRRHHRTLLDPPLMEALKGMSPEEEFKFLNRVVNLKERKRELKVKSLLSAKANRSLASQVLMGYQSIMSPKMDLWSGINLAEAKAAAPYLRRNPHPEAGWVRAYAAAGDKKIESMALPLLKTARFRYDGSGPTYPLWYFRRHNRTKDIDLGKADNQFKKDKQRYKMYEAADASFHRLNKQTGKDSDTKQRLAALNALYDEILGPNPWTTKIFQLWDQLFAKAPDGDLIEMFKILFTKQHEAFMKNARIRNAPGSKGLTAKMRMTAVEREELLVRALEKGGLRIGPVRRVSIPHQPRLPWKWIERNRHKFLWDRAGQLGKHLRGIIGEEAKAGEISDIIFSSWVYCDNPESGGAKSLMRTLTTSEAYWKLDQAYRDLAAHGSYFGNLAIAPVYNPNAPQYLSRELIKLPEKASPDMVEKAFKIALRRVGKEPMPVAVYGLRKVAALPKLDGATRKLALSLFREKAPTGHYPRGQGYEQLGLRLVRQMSKSGRWSDLVPYAPGLWRSADAADNMKDPKIADELLKFAQDAFKNGNPSVALSVARIGLNSGVDAVKVNGKFNPKASKVRREKLKKIAAEASAELGVVEIPVGEKDPDYGIYKSNAEYVKGNLESAWSLYLENEDRIRAEQAGGSGEKPLIQKLPVDYGFWLMERNIEENRTDAAETLVKGMTIWSRQQKGAFTSNQEVELQIAYADLAFLKGNLPTARAWYRRVVETKEHKGTALHFRAALGSVKVDRELKNFGTALDELDTLTGIKTPSASQKIHYARAKVHMEQEAYKEALEEVEEALRADPDLQDALILRAQIQYHMRQLVEASEIEIGITRENNVMVPGEILKINLRDPSLNISSVGADIEVAVWAESGDREKLLLHQFGDRRDRFSAELPTALGSPVPGDKVLQVLGEDKIRFGYSKEFRDRMSDLPPDPDTVIGIAADAHLALSAGAFLPKIGERKLDMSQIGLSSAQKKLGARCVRPGNPIYVRVTDPDQSKTAAIDKVGVKLRTSSGDVIRWLELKENGPLTGEFEGTVMTAPAQATAYASDSSTGHEPNATISPIRKQGWQGSTDKKGGTRIFGVDLNANVSIDKLSLKWGAPDKPITRFVLQTSLNGQDWGPGKRYPEHPAPFDGRPNVRSFLTDDKKQKNACIPVSTPRGRNVPNDWREKMNVTSASRRVRYSASYVSSLDPVNLKLVSGKSLDCKALMQYRALFYQPDMALRTFRLEVDPDSKGNAGKDKSTTKFLIDGKPAEKDSSDPMTIRREISPGLHEIQIWRHAECSEMAKQKPVLLCDVPGQSELRPCPDSMFDPKTFPKGIQDLIPRQPKISKTDDGLDVQFWDKEQARIFRLVIHEFKGPAPSIKSVELTDRNGEQVLPVKHDFASLRENDQLEVLPGDRIVASYEDPVPASKNRARHEQNVSVAYNTATVMATFLNYETTSEGRKLETEPIRRFNMGDAVGFVIEDVDLDASPKRDVAEFKATTSAGDTTTLKAVETEKHSGRFIGRFFPVAGKPARESELKVPEGGTVTLVYRDMENLDPGIAANRSVTIEHARYKTPKLGVYTANSALRDGDGNHVRTLSYNYVNESALSRKKLQAVIGGSLVFNVVAPHKALSASSEITAYAQVRRKPREGGKPFDVNLPGTRKLSGEIRYQSGGKVPDGYMPGGNRGPGSGKTPLDEGRFVFSIGLSLGEPPEMAFTTESGQSFDRSAMRRGLVVKKGDIVDIGYAFKDENGQVQWKTASLEVDAHSSMEVMDRSYREPLEKVYVGEYVYVRVLAPGLDQSSDRDQTSVFLKATSGASAKFDLMETRNHSGEFRGRFKIVYAEKELPEKLPPVKSNGLPVRYGDEVVVTYTPSGDAPEQSGTVKINMGADGSIEPFSKRFTGDKMAVKTTFTLAECFFELAKKHRKMGPKQESLARREMEHARKLLIEAISTHREDDLRAHAEYLLGNLAQEYADLAKNDAAKLPMYQDALARFSKIPVDYPDTEFAPKAQFKMALVYEKMGELEIALEEYVKLAYKYPECEYIPEAMSRLGGYFQSQGQAYKDQADPLREKEDDESRSEVLRLDKLSYPQFIKAATIFAKLQDRFPSHKLAGLAGLRAGQNYMRARQYDKALEAFDIVIKDESYDGVEIRSQAMYWSGLCHESQAALQGTGRIARWRRRDIMREAYEFYSLITFDFPESKWAKYARGRLADPAFAATIAYEKKWNERYAESLREAANKTKEMLK